MRRRVCDPPYEGNPDGFPHRRALRARLLFSGISMGFIELSSPGNVWEALGKDKVAAGETPAARATLGELIS